MTDAAEDLAPPAASPSPARPPGRRLGRFERALLLIALGAFVFRAGYVLATRTDTSLCSDPYKGTVNLLCGDAVWYSGEAHAVGHGKGFVDLTFPGRPGADHPPLTVLALAPLSLVARGDAAPVTAQRLEMALLGTAVVVAVGFLGRRVGGPRGPTIGLIAAGVAAVDANLWMNDVVVMSETLATLGIALSLLAVYRFADRPSWGRAAAVGALVGVTALARAELLLLVPVAFVPVALWARSLRRPERLGRIAVAGTVCLAVLVPWTAYNLARFREPVLLSTNDGLTLVGANCNQVYGLNNEGIEGDQGGIGFWNLGCALRLGDQVPAGADQSEQSKVFRRIGLEYVNEHRDRLRTVAQFRFLRGWGVFAPDQMVWLNQGEGRTPWASWTGYVQWWLLLPLAFAGAVVLRRRRLLLWPLASMAVVVTMTVIGFYGIVRFRLAADVAAVVLAAVALDRAWAWWSTRRASAATRRDPAGSASRDGTGAEDGFTAITEPPRPEELVPARHGATHFPCLDAYRGIGMTMVLLNHAAYATGYLFRDGTIPQFLTPFIARLDLSVPMFFVMSGFLLYRPFARASLTGRDLPDVRTFYRRRVLRILPAYWVALLGVGLLFGVQITGVKTWVGNALVLPAFGVPVPACTASGDCHVAYALTQAWSIGVEATYYLVLPAVAWVLHRLAARRHGPGRLAVQLGGLGVLYLASTAFRAAIVGANPSWAEQTLLWLPMFGDLFAIGMALAVVSAAVAGGRPVPRLLAWLGDHPNGAWMVAGAIWLVVTRMKYPTKPFGLRDADGSSDYLPRQFLYGVASAVWLAPAMFGDQTKGALRRVLASRPLVYLGAISLSFYLWHLAIIEQVKLWTVPDYLSRVELAAHPPPGNTLAGVATFTGNYGKVVIISWVVTFLVAGVLYRFVELPFLRLKDEPLRALWSARANRHPGPPAGEGPEPGADGAPVAAPDATVDAPVPTDGPASAEPATHA